MSCELTSGYNKLCDTPGGVDTWYLFSTKDSNGESNIDTLTVANGAVTALTLKTGKYAYPFNVEIETSSFTDTAVGERANGAYAREQSATVMLHGNTAEMIVQIESLCKGRTTLIAKLNDGTYEVLFLQNGAKCNDERASGTAYEDMNGNTLTFTGKEPAKAVKISSTIVLALLEPAS
jgi:hypothetical protein